MPRGGGIGKLTKEQRVEAVKKAQESRKKNTALQAQGRFFEPGAKVSLMKRIKCKCLDCSNFSKLEIRMCPVKDCPLWEVRMGRRTMRANVSPEEAKELENMEVDIEKDDDDLEPEEVETEETEDESEETDLDDIEIDIEEK